MREFRLSTQTRSKSPVNSGVGAAALLCPSDEIRRFVQAETIKSKTREFRCATCDVWNLQLKQGLTMLNPYTTVDAGFITLGSASALLCPSDEIRRSTCQQDHPPRRSAPPLQGWDPDQEKVYDAFKGSRLMQETNNHKCRCYRLLILVLVAKRKSASPLFFWFRFVACVWLSRFGPESGPPPF